MLELSVPELRHVLYSTLGYFSLATLSFLYHPLLARIHENRNRVLHTIAFLFIASLSLLSAGIVVYSCLVMQQLLHDLGNFIGFLFSITLLVVHLSTLFSLDREYRLKRSQGVFDMLLQSLQIGIYYEEKV